MKGLGVMSIICVGLALSLGWIHILEVKRQERIDVVSEMPNKAYLRIQKNIQRGMGRLKLADTLDQMREQGKKRKKQAEAEKANDISGDDRDWLNSLLATIGE